MKRYVTYDIREGKPCNDLYEYFEKIKAKMITKSFYETNVELPLDKFCDKLRAVTEPDDTVLVITRTEHDLFCERVR